MQSNYLMNTKRPNDVTQPFVTESFQAVASLERYKEYSANLEQVIITFVKGWKSEFYENCKLQNPLYKIKKEKRMVTFYEYASTVFLQILNRFNLLFKW